MSKGIPRYHALHIESQKVIAISNTITGLDHIWHRGKCLILDYKERRWARGWTVQPFSWSFDWDEIGNILRQGIQ
jgi:hypothetical protein